MQRAIFSYSERMGSTITVRIVVRNGSGDGDAGTLRKGAGKTWGMQTRT